MTTRDGMPSLLSVHLGAVRLWREDLAETVSVIERVYEVQEMYADHNRIDDVASGLASLRKARLKSFFVVASDARIKLKIDKTGAKIEILDPTIIDHGLVSEIRGIMVSRQRGLVTLNTTRSLLIYGGGLLTFAIGAWLYLALDNDGFMQSMGPASWWILGGLCIVFWRTVGPHFRSVLYTCRRDEAPGWLRRNTDALVTNTIVSAVFLVIGLIIQRLQKAP